MLRIKAFVFYNRYHCHPSTVKCFCYVSLIGLFPEAFSRTHEQVELSSPNAELRVLEVFYHKIYQVVMQSDVAWLESYMVHGFLWFILLGKNVF